MILSVSRSNNIEGGKGGGVFSVNQIKPTQEGRIMDGVNKVILIGNVGKDAELKYTGPGTAVSSFTLATNETWKNKDGAKQSKTEWHTVVIWGRMAEGISKYITKGKNLFIEGKITTRSWEDKDGNKRYKTEIVASEVKFLGAAEKRDNGDYRTGTAEDQSQQQEESAPPPADDDDLPF